jgi:myosin protein heavy chain
MIMSSPPSSTQSPAAHTRHQSYSSLAAPISSHNASLSAAHSRLRGGSSSSGTFAPSFIKAESTQRGAEAVRAIEGENDFSGKRYVWLNDPDMAFVKGWVVEELESNQILVQCDDGSVCFLDPLAFAFH